MAQKNFRWVIPLLLGLLTIIACGQLSVGVVPPTIENEVVVTPAADILVAADDSINTDADNYPVSDGGPIEVPIVPSSPIPTIAYIGLDNNVWVLESGTEAPRQLTFDATLVYGEETTIEYYFPQVSSDGTLLAYRMSVGTPVTGGYEFASGLWVLNLTTGEQRQILEGRTGSMAWKPGTHLLTYGKGVDIEYFITRGEPDADLAAGIFVFDMDTGETVELIAPERGYALSSPSWSADGRFLAFTEVFNMEGSGLFAYYDFENEEYFAWDESVGQISFSPDGSMLTYARHTYAASGDERLYLRPLQGSEQLLGPDYDGPAYATHPVFSPDGNQIAYLAFEDGPDVYIATLMVLDLTSGDLKSFGEFEDTWELAWVPDGSHVVFGFGPYETPKIIAINTEDGSQVLLAEGTQPTLAGQ